MIILVTGGSGLVGNAIKSLTSNNKQHTWIFLNSKECDLRDYTKTKHYISDLSPDIIIHLAACVGGLYKNINYKKEMFEDNILLNFNVLKVAFDLNVKRVISCLSTCVFPDNISYPITEDKLHNGEPHTSNYPYAYSKRFLEIQSRIYNELGSHFCCVIPTNLYGINDNFSIENGHVIPSLIHKFYLAKESNSNVTLFGDGKALRQFLYVNDLARFMISLAFEYDGKDTFIISPDETDEISILSLAKLIAKYMNFKGKIILNKHYPSGQYKKTASNKKLKTHFPNFKFTHIDEGLKDTIKWFIRNYPNIRK
tara:strand:+ start:3411 stop:4343 length:933 start_codon:yes stop_codon:yes gene_type:complete